MLISLSASLATCGSSSFVVILFLHSKSFGEYIWNIFNQIGLFYFDTSVKTRFSLLHAFFNNSNIQDLNLITFFFRWRDTHQVDCFFFAEIEIYLVDLNSLLK